MFSFQGLQGGAVCTVYSTLHTALVCACGVYSAAVAPPADTSHNKPSAQTSYLPITALHKGELYRVGSKREISTENTC